jgi:hypothetical protein
MSNSQSEPIIPQQQGGGASDTDATATFDSPVQAKEFYQVAKQRLLQVNNWQKWAGAATASFQLTDTQGADVDRTVQEGDHFKIDIPGPGPVTGDGYDWVQVETITEMASDDMEEVAIQVRPATNPNNSRHDVAHFFSEEASSCFIVKREGNTVTAEVHGRNEKPNTHAETLVDKARNTTVAAGAIAAFSKLQWKSLVNGLVKHDK